MQEGYFNSDQFSQFMKELDSELTEGVEGNSADYLYVMDNASVHSSK